LEAESAKAKLIARRPGDRAWWAQAEEPFGPS
jgi:hypothetical protein